MTNADIEQMNKEFESFLSDLPMAPKSKKWGTGCYYTKNDIGILEIRKNSMTGFWMVIVEGEYADSFERKCDALEACRSDNMFIN